MYQITNFEYLIFFTGRPGSAQGYYSQQQQSRDNSQDSTGNFFMGKKKLVKSNNSISGIFLRISNLRKWETVFFENLNYYKDF